MLKRSVGLTKPDQAKYHDTGVIDAYAGQPARRRSSMELIQTVARNP